MRKLLRTANGMIWLLTSGQCETAGRSCVFSRLQGFKTEWRRNQSGLSERFHAEGNVESAGHAAWQALGGKSHLSPQKGLDTSLAFY